MTATNDCNMIASIILNFISIPLVIQIGLEISPHLSKGFITPDAFISIMNTILLGFGIIFLCGMIMGFGNWIDSIDLI